MNARILGVTLAAIGVLLVAGFPATNVRGAPGPTLSIVSPANGAVIGNGTPVAVVFAVTNFNLTEQGNGTSSPDSGHVDIFVDGGSTGSAATNTIVLSLPSGPHTILLRLVMNNGSALNPDVTASVSMMMTQGPAGATPGLSIVSPREGALLGTDFTVSFRVTNFVLVPGGPAGVPNEGQVRVQLDGSFYADLTEATPIHFSLRDGPHNVTLQLEDSGHRPLDPAVVVSLHITVKALVGRVTPFDATPYLALANVLLGLAILAAIYRKLEVR